MDKLCYSTLKDRGYAGYLLEHAPERILQFGEGGFLRAFVESFVDEMNESAGFNGKVVVVQPRGGHPDAADRFNAQDGLYTLILRGRENGEKISRTRVISCVSRCLDPKRDWAALLDCAANPDLRFIISNTTEAGIVFDDSCSFNDAPPSSFPAKLTAFLYQRFRLKLPGFWILPCELNDHNGELLRSCILKYAALWNLEDSFLTWLETENHICSTLVDRIVTGALGEEVPKLWDELGYQDDFIDAGEVFASWVIEAPQQLKEELPFQACGLPIQVVDDHTPYKQRKVRILNGAHTSTVLGAYLSGQNIVRGCMSDSVIRSFMTKTIQEEIIPTLDLPIDELRTFADAVTERFDNPYIDHSLLAIALNSTAKWKARVLPSVLDYTSKIGTLPPCLTLSFAAYISFYHQGTVRGNGCLIGTRNDESYMIKDDPWVLDFYYEHRLDNARELAHAVIHNTRMWGDQLAVLPGFEDKVVFYLERIQEVGMYKAFQECL